MHRYLHDMIIVAIYYQDCKIRYKLPSFKSHDLPLG